MHLLVAAFLGVKPESSGAPAHSGRDNQVAEIVAAGFPIAAHSVHDGFESAPVLDFAALKAQAAARRQRG